MVPYTNEIVAGWGTSHSLSFGVFDFGKTLKLYVPKAGKGQVTTIKGAYNVISVVNSGVFQINEELDNTLVYCNFDTAKTLLEFKLNEITAIELLVSGDIELISSKINS